MARHASISRARELLTRTGDSILKLCNCLPRSIFHGRKPVSLLTIFAVLTIITCKPRSKRMEMDGRRKEKRKRELDLLYVHISNELLLFFGWNRDPDIRSRSFISIPLNFTMEFNSLHRFSRPFLDIFKGGVRSSQPPPIRRFPKSAKNFPVRVNRSSGMALAAHHRFEMQLRFSTRGTSDIVVACGVAVIKKLHRF